MFFRLARGLFAAAIVAAAPLALFAQDTLVRKVGELPTARQMHGAAVLGDFLYVFGGELGGYGGKDLWTNTVLKAPIGADGAVGQWTPTTPLPSVRSYIGNATMALNDIVYIVGGADNDKTSTAIWARPDAQGNLSNWEQSPPFQGEALSCFPVVSTPGYIHILGGLTKPGQVLPLVQSGRIGAGGAIVAWEPAPPLPTPLWFHNAVALGGRVWVWSGLVTPEPSSQMSGKVYSCSILSAGALGPWRQEPTAAPLNFHSGAMATAGPFLLSFCPVGEGYKASSDVWYTTVTANGLGAWNRVPTPLPVRRYIAVAPDYRRGNVYIPGGRVRTGDGGPENFDHGVYMFSLSSRARQGAPAMTYPAASTGYSYQTEANLGKGALAGFMPYPVARKAAAGPPAKPLVLYFNTTAKTCQQQNELLATPEFRALRDKAAFAWIDANDASQLNSQLGIYRVPTWIVYDTSGAEKGRATQVVTAPQIAKLLGTLK